MELLDLEREEEEEVPILVEAKIVLIVVEEDVMEPQTRKIGK